MTKMSFNTQQLLELSLFPIRLEGEKAVTQAQTKAATVAAQIQTAILEGIVPDEETAQLRRENARLSAVIENAKLATEAKKYGVKLGDKEKP